MNNLGDRVIICEDNWKEQFFNNTFKPAYGSIKGIFPDDGGTITVVSGDDGRDYVRGPSTFPSHVFFTESEFRKELNTAIAERESQIARLNNEISLLKSSFANFDLGQYRGVNGECRWNIDREGTLTIFPADGKMGVLENQASLDYKAPWDKYAREIKKVIVEPGVVASRNASYLFYGLRNCKEMDLSGLDTFRVKNMDYMFANCDSLVRLDITDLDRSNLETTRCMFSKCRNLEYIKVGESNFPKLADKTHMFLGCDNFSGKRFLESRLSKDIAQNAERDRKIWSPEPKKDKQGKDRRSVSPER